MIRYKTVRRFSIFTMITLLKRAAKAKGEQKNINWPKQWLPLSICLVSLMSPHASWLQKVTDNSQSAHTHLELGAGLLSQTIFFKPELPDHIFAWKTTPNLDPFAFLFRLWHFWNGANCLLNLLLSAFNLFYTEPIDSFQVKIYPVHYQAKVLIGFSGWKSLLQPVLICLPLQCLLCCTNLGFSGRVLCTPDGLQCLTQCLQKMTCS